MEKATEMLTLRGFDEALLGPVKMWVQTDNGMEQVILLAYSGDRVVRKVMRDKSVGYDEARDYVEQFLMDDPDGWLGPNTPVLVWPLDELVVSDETLQ